LLVYPDGNCWQLAVLHFAAEPLQGELIAGVETTDVGYFTASEMEQLEMGDFDRQRVNDSFAAPVQPFIR
jgi:hypothetical protein